MKQAIKTIFIATMLGLAGSLCLQASVANRLGNPGFENALGGSGNWDATAGRGITLVAVGAPAGSQFLRLDESTTTLAGGGAFTFQTVTGVNPGDVVAINALARETANDANDDGELRIEFETSGGTDIATLETSISTAAFSRFALSGTAPAGTAQVTFTLRVQNIEIAQAAGTTVDFDDVIGSINGFPIFLDAAPANNSVQPGQMTAVVMKVQNQSANALAAVEVVANPQPGLSIHQNSTLDGKVIPQREGSVIFSLGSLSSGQENLLTFPVLLTSGVIPGKSYEISLVVRNAGGALSSTVRVRIRADWDPVFQEGTVIGKVFNDGNQNGAQDSGEKGVPFVRLVTEEGIIVITDEHGKYHIPAVRPGRHIVKIDGHTLPEGTKFITEESLLIKTTEGILNKANFAVLLPPSEIPEAFQKDLAVTVTQGLDTSRPDLEVSADLDVLKVGLGTLEENPVFKFKINYGELVKTWKLEVRDDLGREIWTGLGVGAPPSEVVWSGQANNETMVRPGFYSYQLKVEDKDGHEDWTALQFLRVISKSNHNASDAKPDPIPAMGDFNIFKDGKRSIPLIAKPTLHIQGRTKPGYKVTVNGSPVTVDSEEGTFQSEIYTTPGGKEVIVVATSPKGESLSYRKAVKVKDSTFFMVGLGEEQLGVNFQGGNIETTGDEDLYKDGFYENGRLSYYLKGKLKGKFLVKSHYDTSDKRSALFTNLDPDDYYPIYGDASTRDYEAIDTRDRFYLVIEMDRSYVKWGSFQTEFNETETATYHRTLSGFKMNYESLASTPYGDPKRSFKLFASRAQHRADHNEFAATGGSLYYLRNRSVIEGSEKIRVEVRDKIQEMSIASYDLAEGADYEIDYAQGRIMLSRPLSSVAASDTIVSQDLLDGNPVFLIADYEYDAGSNANFDDNRGLRLYTHMGDHLRIGATAVEEKRQNVDYDLRGVDATMKFGRNTKITSEYATALKEQVKQAVSYNGGLSFANLELLRGRNTRPRENAYLIKAESKPVQNTEIAGYVQGVEPSFSTDRLRSQEGTKKYGLSARYKVHDNLGVRYRFDSSEVADQLRPLQEHGVQAPFHDLKTHTFQAAFDDGKRLAHLEYRHQDTSLPRTNLVPTLVSEYPFSHGVTGKVGYHLNDKLLPYVKVQGAFDGKPNHQYGGGVRYEVIKSVHAYMEQMKGKLGDATQFGFEKEHKEGVKSYANMRMLEPSVGAKAIATTIGSSYALSEKSRVYSEKERATYEGYDGYADILGYDGKMGDRWDYGGKFERRHLRDASTRLMDQQAQLALARSNTFNTLSGNLGYANGDKLRARTMLEFRYDPDSADMWQALTRNSVKYEVNQDLSFLGKIDFGKSRFTEPNDVPADFMEMSTGFAYRPIDHDRLNILTRYTYLRERGSDAQFFSELFSGVELDETSHIVSVDLAYDLFRHLTTVEKVAYKHGVLNTSLTNEVVLNTILLAHRFNFHVTRQWDIAAEYRILFQTDAMQSLKHGALVEVDRELYDYVRIGAGYNFTDFDDDLRKANNYDSHGPFVRLSGKF